MSILNQITKQKENGRKLIIYCAGLHGSLFYNVLKTCGIRIDFFADSNSSKWGTIIEDDIICVSPEEVKRYDCMGFICVKKSCYKGIYEFVCKEKLFEIIEMSSIIDELVLNNRRLYLEVLSSHAKQKEADIFYDLHPNRKGLEINIIKPDTNKRGKKVAVYTAVFGGYDAVCFPRYLNHEMDFFYVSDNKPNRLPEYYHWIDAKDIIPAYITSPIQRNRFVKMHPHLFLKDYSYSIYLDGNVIIKEDISNFIRESKTGIAVYMHPMRECIYYEALSTVNFKRVDVDDVCAQMERYLEEGMPCRYGLTEMPVIAREHMKKACVGIMETWWKEFEHEAQRDQLSFMYALWKNGFALSDLACLGKDVRNCSQIEFCGHAIESMDVKNELACKGNGGYRTVRNDNH